jgi:esterase/lipase superfamily enzyme
LFVHGYNVSFREAALRAAQIGFDLRVNGVTAFFSWPSKGDLIPYPADEASVELAERHFVSFLELLGQVHELERIDVLAHSMGNRLLLRTVEHLLRKKREGTLGVPIGHIVLAAADVTAALFKQCATSYAELAGRRVTNYTYKADRALMASRKLHDQDRVGLEPPVFVHDGIETISASELDLDLLGHGYVATAAPLLYDVRELIHGNTPPRSRLRLEPVTPQQCRYWALAR